MSIIKSVLIKTEKGIRYVENVLVFVSGGFFMILMFLGTGDVIGRFLFNRPIVGTYEISEMIMGAIVLLGWAYTQRVGEHVKVDLLYNRLSPLMQKITSLIVDLLLLLLLATILVESWEIAIEAVTKERQFLTIHWPTGPFYFLVPVGAFFICLEIIINLFHTAAKLKKE